MPDNTKVAPELECFAIHADAPKIVPARSERDWMDLTDQRYAYRCIPLAIANASGWEVLSPLDFQASWNGGQGKDALTLSAPGGDGRLARFAVSHFGHGILTFHLGYVFRTSAGWALWARGTPNTDKRRIVPLEGIIETDWLPFSFTMNWRFTRSGIVRFARGEPVCFLTLVPHAILDQVAPVLHRLEDDPALAAAHRAWADGRGQFNTRLAAGDPATVAEGWQKNYVRGAGPDLSRPESFSKLHPHDSMRHSLE